MNPYQVRFKPEAQQGLEALGHSSAQRVLDKLKWLSEHFDELRPEALAADLQGLYKLRVGSYRVIYAFDRSARVLTIHLVGHRRDIYR